MPRDFRDAIEERVYRTQPRECIVRLPAQVLSPRMFDVDPGDVLDLRGVRFLSTDAMPGLIRLVRDVGPVQIIAVQGLQPYEKLVRLFGKALAPDLSREHGWVIDPTSGGIP